MDDIRKKSISEVNPSVSIGRSTFNDLSFTHTTTMTSGDLVPIYVEEVLPGDTFSITTRSFIRMSTPIFPVMDNAYVDVAYFFVPNRLVWDHFRQFMGENTEAPWTQLTEYTVPQLKFNISHSFENDKSQLSPRKGSVANYIGAAMSLYPSPGFVSGDGSENIPIEYSISDLPNRAYRLIWNEFYRSEAVQYPVSVYKDDSDRSYTRYIPGVHENYGDLPLKVCRFFDYFSAVLPSPQQGPAVSAGLFNSLLPVIPKLDMNNLSELNGSGSQLRFAKYTGNNWVSQPLSDTLDSSLYIAKNSNILRADVGEALALNETRPVVPYNLAAIADNLNLATVNQLREAFAIQRYQEQLARSGSRYREQVRALFGVTIPDSTVQIPEYLGGQRLPVQINQVVQTSSSDSVSPQGNVSAYSLTTAKDASFIKSFVEHGMIIGLACIRVSHTYAQATRPFLYRKRRFDYYFPQFASLGEQPVLKKVICATGIPKIDNQVFGYNEAFADYRYRPNMVSGAFSPDVYMMNDTVYENESPLASAWTYADWYRLNYNVAKQEFNTSSLTVPTLSGEWLQEDSGNVQKTLAVDGEPQFISQFDFEVTATRPMPVHSIPGLIDHH